MASGQRFRVLNVIDDVTKQYLATISDTTHEGTARGRRAALGGMTAATR